MSVPKTDPVKDINLAKGATANRIIKEMFDSGGFTAKKLAQSVDVIEAMVKDSASLNFLSFPADIIATGSRGIIKDMIKNKWFRIVSTTCGTLDHDLARVWKDYYHGDFMMDDNELREQGINRLGNVLVPNESYGDILEKKMAEFLDKLYREGVREISTHELCWKLGEFVNDPRSIVYWCWKNKIPMIIPGPTDGSVGYQIWQFCQDHKDFKLNLIADETLLSNLVWENKVSGALLIGGGISKHHVIWWNQFKDGLDYVAYITTAVEHDGSLSGARPREAVSWGKIKAKAKQVHVEEDATIALPIIYAALLERM